MNVGLYSVVEACFILCIRQEDEVIPKLYFQPLKYTQCAPHEQMTKQKVPVEDHCKFILVFVKQMTTSCSNGPVLKAWNAFGETRIYF